MLPRAKDYVNSKKKEIAKKTKFAAMSLGAPASLKLSPA